MTSKIGKVKEKQLIYYLVRLLFSFQIAISESHFFKNFINQIFF